MANEIKNKKVNDGELNEVVGGVINWGDGKGNGYQEWKQDVEFAFNIGDRVETWRFIGTQRGTVIDRKIEEIETIDPASAYGYNYRPKYLVRLDKDGSSEWYDQDFLSY